MSVLKERFLESVDDYDAARHTRQIRADLARHAAIKATLMQYTQTQVLDLAAKNTRVNCVAHGSIYFKGGTWDDAEQNNKPLFDGNLKSISHGRFGMPEEVADLTVYLAFDAARWVTGQADAV